MNLLHLLFSASLEPYGHRRPAHGRPLETNRLDNHESYLICPGKSPILVDPNSPVSRLHVIFHTIWHPHHRRPVHDHNLRGKPIASTTTTPTPTTTTTTSQSRVPLHRSNSSSSTARPNAANSTAKTPSKSSSNSKTSSMSASNHLHRRTSSEANNDHHRNTYNHKNHRKQIVVPPVLHRPPFVVGRGRYPSLGSTSTMIHIWDCSDEDQEEEDDYDTDELDRINETDDGEDENEEDDDESNHITRSDHVEFLIDVYHWLAHRRRYHRPRPYN